LIRLFSAVLWILLLPVICFSQSEESVLTVKDALNFALQNNPELNRVEEQIRIQESDLGLSWGIESPELFYFKEGIKGNSFSEKRYGISQSMQFPLTGYYQNRRAKSDVQRVEKLYEAELIRLRAEVKKAYTELAFSIKKIGLIERRMGLARELREIAQARLEVGESTELDLIQADIQYTQAQNDFREAKQMKNEARYALFRVIGLDPEQQKYGVSFPDTLSYFDADISQKNVLQGLEEIPEIQSFQKNVESANRGVKVAKSNYLPDLRADYYRQDFGSGFEFDGFEIGVSVPLWFGLNQSNRVKQAKAVQRQAEWTVSEATLKVKERAENAWHRYETSRNTIISYREVIQSRATNLLELTREGYRLGELELLRVLEAQRTFLSAEEKYYQSLRNYYLQLIELERYLPNELVFTE
jgi:outer membrane protein, heavy metal efflux system